MDPTSMSVRTEHLAGQLAGKIEPTKTPGLIQQSTNTKARNQKVKDTALPNLEERGSPAGSTHSLSSDHSVKSANELPYVDYLKHVRQELVAERKMWSGKPQTKETANEIKSYDAAITELDAQIKEAT